MGALFMNDNFIDKKEIRYNSLKEAFNRLNELVNENISNQSDIIKKGIIDGIIQRFEFTFELMWKVLKDYMESIGFSDFSQGPKGVLKFHKSGAEMRTALEEHLEEGAQYAAGKTGVVKVHFTVSPEHRALFQEIIDSKRTALEDKYGVKLEVSMS